MFEDSNSVSRENDGDQTLEEMIAGSGRDIVDPEGLRTRVVAAVRSDQAKQDFGRNARSGFFTAVVLVAALASVVPYAESVRQDIFSRTASGAGIEAIRISQESRLDPSWAMVEVFQKWRWKR